MLRLHLFSMILFAFFLVGCQHEIPASSSGHQLYYEIGETFQFEGYSSKLPFQVKVKKVWMEDYLKHQEHINEHVKKPEELGVLFIEYEVKNLGNKLFQLTDDQLYPYNDVLPNFLDPRGYIYDIDLTYPPNKLVKSNDELSHLKIAPSKSLTITGTVITKMSSENNGAFVWNFSEDIPNVVFTSPHSKRKAQVGVYDLGETIYLTDDHNRELKVTINSVDEVRSAEKNSVKRVNDGSSLLIIDMEIENKGDDNVLFSSVIPKVSFRERVSHHYTALQFVHEHNGEIESIDYDKMIEPNERISGQLYYEMYNDFDEDIVIGAQLFYPYPGFRNYPIYSQIINVNLDADRVFGKWREFY